MRLSEYLDCFSFICSTWELKQLWGGGCLVPDLCITYFFSKQNEQRWVQFDYQASKMLSAFILRIFAEVLQHSTCNLKIGGLCITRQRVHRHASSSVRQYFVFLLFSMFTILVNIRLGSVLGIWSYTKVLDTFNCWPDNSARWKVKLLFCYKSSSGHDKCLYYWKFQPSLEPCP